MSPHPSPQLAPPPRHILDTSWSLTLLGPAIFQSSSQRGHQPSSAALTSSCSSLPAPLQGGSTLSLSETWQGGEEIGEESSHQPPLPSSCLFLFILVLSLHGEVPVVPCALLRAVPLGIFVQDSDFQSAPTPPETYGVAGSSQLPAASRRISV